MTRKWVDKIINCPITGIPSPAIFLCRFALLTFSPIADIFPISAIISNDTEQRTVAQNPLF
jgi:hypothetical protein